MTYRAAALTLLVVMAASGRAPAEVHEFALPDIRLMAAQVRDGRIELGDCFDAGQADALAFEAEAAIDLKADPAQSLQGAACSGGRCIVGVDGARFPFHLGRAGQYQCWYRALFPRDGTWIHKEAMDFGKPAWHTDHSGAATPDWVWIKGPTYDLSEGVHLLWLYNWHGGAMLDKIVLSPAGAPAPEGMGPNSIDRTPAREGWAMTPAVFFPGLRHIDTLDWPGSAASGAVSLFLSYLDGGELIELPTSGPLPEEMDMPAGSKVQLRVRLRRPADGNSPRLDAPSIGYKTAPRALVTLESESLRARFLKDTGGLVELLDKRADAQCIAGAEGVPPFLIHHLPGDARKPIPVPSSEVKLTSLDASPKRLRMMYRVLGGAQVVMLVRLEGRELSFSSQVTNRTDRELVNITCPYLPGLRLGPECADDIILTPNWQGGVKTVNPVSPVAQAWGIPPGEPWPGWTFTSPSPPTGSTCPATTSRSWAAGLRRTPMRMSGRSPSRSRSMRVCDPAPVDSRLRRWSGSTMATGTGLLTPTGGGPTRGCASPSPRSGCARPTAGTVWWSARTPTISPSVGCRTT